MMYFVCICGSSIFFITCRRFLNRKAMRMFLLSLLLWGISISAMAEKQYKIFKVTEGVTLKSPQGDKVTVNKRMEVTLGDILYIPIGGKVGILETESKQIYYSSTTGEVRVVKIVVDAKKQADSSIAAVNQQIANSIAEQQQAGPNFSIVGAAHRGVGADTCTLQVYASLSRILADASLKGKENPLQLSLKKEEDAFFFSLQNPTGKPLFLNILKITAGSQTPYVCLQPGHSAGTPYILLNASGTRDLQEITFANEEEEACYLLFGCEQMFDSQLLQRLFEMNAQPLPTGCTLYTAAPIKE